MPARTLARLGLNRRAGLRASDQYPEVVSALVERGSVAMETQSL